MICCVEIGCWIQELPHIPGHGDPIAFPLQSESAIVHTLATLADTNRPQGEKCAPISLLKQTQY